MIGLCTLRLSKRLIFDHLGSIVLVPGLGAHPEDSWKSSKTDFNWTKEILPQTFSKARILLYMYESAWIGSLQVQQFMGAIAKSLLVALRTLREASLLRAMQVAGNADYRPSVHRGSREYQSFS